MKKNEGNSFLYSFATALSELNYHHPSHHFPSKAISREMSSGRTICKMRPDDHRKFLNNIEDAAEGAVKKYHQNGRTSCRTHSVQCEEQSGLSIKPLKEDQTILVRLSCACILVYVIFFFMYNTYMYARCSLLSCFCYIY